MHKIIIKKKTDGQFFTADDKNKSVTGHFDEFGLVDMFRIVGVSYGFSYGR
jgi:hypothetical protein